MLDLDTLVAEGLLICPRCSSSVRPGDGWRCVNTTCEYAQAPFPVVAGQPALVDFEHSVLSADDLQSSTGRVAAERRQQPGVVSRLVHPPDEQSPRNARRLLDLLRHQGSAGPRPRVLVVGSSSVGDGLEELYADSGIDLVAFDVHASAHTQFVADGHRIPLVDESMDGVVVQAVLERVLEPSVVVAEIHRVLRKGGVVYAATPFLQDMKAGPLLLTRFTESGHRSLFRHFERVDSGVVAGAGTALRWSIGHFFRALTRSVVLGRLAALGFFWLSWLDRYLDSRHALDAASSVYFLGIKTSEEISARDIVGPYRGVT